MLRIIIILSLVYNTIVAQNWQVLDTNLRGAPHSLYFDTVSNSMLVGGQFYRCYNSDTIVGIGQFKNGQWQKLGDGVDWNKEMPLCSSCLPNPVNSIIRYKDTIYITGEFSWTGKSYTNGTKLNGIAKWNGSNWVPLRNGLKDNLGANGIGYKFKIYNNTLYLVGAFDSICGVPANGLAKFDGFNWSSVNNLPRINPTNSNMVYDIEFYSGEIFVGGIMDNGSTIKDLVKWNGISWVNPGFNCFGFGFIKGITVYNGELYVLGSFSSNENSQNLGNSIAKYNGTVWSNLSSGIFSNPNLPAIVSAYKVYNNKMYLGGKFDKCNEASIFSITVFDGTNFCSLDTSINFNQGVECIEFYKDTLFIGGYLKTGNNGYSIGMAKCVNYNNIEKCSATAISVHEIHNDKNIMIYPSPTSDVLQIEYENAKTELTHLKIINSIGQVVVSTELKNDIDVSNLQSGIYVLKLKSKSGEVTTRRFVVAR